MENPERSWMMKEQSTADKHIITPDVSRPAGLEPGSADFPLSTALGANVCPDGVRFALFSRHATAVTVLLFAHPDDRQPRREIPLDPQSNRTGDIWHITVPGLKPGQAYLYQVDGPYRPEEGHRFDGSALLLDPYAKAVTRAVPMYNAAGAHSFVRPVPKCIVVDDTFDWAGDRPLHIPPSRSIIYETHVRGLTCHPSAGNRHPGTFRGVIEMIPYLQHLGITAVELLPVQEFHEWDIYRSNARTHEPLRNYWGYSTVAFFAPNSRYSSSGGAGQQVVEFKEMVRELHRAGLELILDIVFNHTAEGNEHGPTISFRGIDNVIYYMLERDKRFYRNFSGCGNTLNCNHPVVRDFIMDCLRYWVLSMHVDGFRFDLASILGRDREGNLVPNPPLVERIAEDPILRGTKIIAEAWDAAGAYQVGSFPGGRWAEWNGRFRDDVRRFWCGEKVQTGPLATRLAGSSDLYLRDGRAPFHSVNFITCHDGFTLNDLVSYNYKHNEANGEDNLDGENYNISCNYGAEGPTDNPKINAIRLRQQKNFLATLMLSQGVPMVLGGDEFGRTQRGNNNAYCQDNEISWYDWTLQQKNEELFRFFRELVGFRRRHPALRREHFFDGEKSPHNQFPDIRWYDHRGREPEWHGPRRCLGCFINGHKLEIAADEDDNDFYMMFNSGPYSRLFMVPVPPSLKSWSVAIDTGKPSPQDIAAPGSERVLSDQLLYHVAGRSVVVLLSFG